jgi:hypothetical protein
MRSLPRFVTVTLACLLLATAGCATLAISPATSETRMTYTTKDDSRTLTVLERITFNDSAKIKVFSVTLPKGTYKLEAVDDDYWYLRAPVPMQRNSYDGDNVADSSLFSGGIMIGRKAGMSVPAGVYRSDGSLNMTMIWKFTDDFMKAEGKSWTRTK